MARSERILTARGIAALTEPGRYSDGGGLYLVIGKEGRRSWVWFYYRNGKRAEMGLGSAETVGLKEARDARDRWRSVLQEGRDPLSERKTTDAHAPVPSFADCAEKLIADKAPGWKNAKHKAQWTATLVTHAASLWEKPVDQIDTRAVLEVLRPIWMVKAETASRVRGRIEAVIDWAKAHNYREGENPARWRGHLDKLLPKPKKLTRGHHKALPYKEAPAFMARLRQREAVAGLALEFTILTAARSGEVREARWTEVDEKEGVWTIPAERMKGGREHRVALSRQALAVLERIKGWDPEFIFPGQRAKKPLSNMAMDNLLARMDQDVTTHGFRSTFRDWAGDETLFQREVIEAALSHIVGEKEEQAYRRSDALEKRRALMQAWADYVCGEASTNVVPLKRKAAG